MVGMICLNSEGLYFLDQLKNLRAITMEDLDKDKLYNDCIKNMQVYDEDGKFIPYSTTINTIEEHEVLCQHYSERQLERQKKSELQEQ